jgi:hypothetical protein
MMPTSRKRKMARAATALATMAVLLFALLGEPAARAYLIDTTIPQAAGSTGGSCR